MKSSLKAAWKKAKQLLNSLAVVLVGTGAVCVPAPHRQMQRAGSSTAWSRFGEDCLSGSPQCQRQGKAGAAVPT